MVQSGGTDRRDVWARERIVSLLRLICLLLLKLVAERGPTRAVARPDSVRAPCVGELFAQALIAAWPELPVEDEERLRDPEIQQAFLDRVFTYLRRQRS